MISLCVFSKNRTLQLDAFLRSLVNAPYMTDVKVLYTYDDIRFKEGYDILIKEHTNVEFLKERPREYFKDTILNLVGGFQEYFAWATDDSIFYRATKLTQEKLDWVFKDQKALSLNLRIGKNIKFQNHWSNQPVPSIIVKDQFEDIITWDSSNIDVGNDVGRLWQSDASIMYRDMYLERLLKEDHWYKGLGVRGLDNVGQSGGIFNPRIGACFKESVYLNLPLNLTHVLDSGRLYADNFSKFRHYDVIDLNDLFLLGKRIDLDRLDVSNVDCGRRECELFFKDKKDV